MQEPALAHRLLVIYGCVSMKTQLFRYYSSLIVGHFISNNIQPGFPVVNRACDVDR